MAGYIVSPGLMVHRDARTCGFTMLKQILNEFLSNDGVTTAALIGRDGFVIEIAEKDSESDIEALGALSSSLMRFFDRNRMLQEMGSLHQITLEYRDGVVLISPLTAEEFLEYSDKPRIIQIDSPC